MQYTDPQLAHGLTQDVSIRLITDDGDPVRGADGHAYAAETRDGDRIWVAVAPAVDWTPSPDEWYDLGDALCLDPSNDGENAVVERVRADEWRCPECGDPATFQPSTADPPEGVSERLAAALDGLVVVVREATTVSTGGETTAWSFPDGIGAPSSRRGRSHSGDEDLLRALGSFVCDSGHETDVAEMPDAGTDTAARRTMAGGGVTHGAAPVEADAMAAPSVQSQAAETIGVAAGGGKDVDNFRENVAEGYLPQPAALSDEGLFYDYYFDTGEGAAGDGLFYPTYSAAVSEHPLTGERERYLTVGLNSTLSVANFERPPLDLVAVLDVSGSMSSGFDQYYYDEHGRRQSVEEPSAETKMAAARQSLVALTEQLDPEDRLGVVLFNNAAGVAKPLRDVGSTDMDAIREHIREVQAGGGTNMADGFRTARDMLLESERDGPVPGTDDADGEGEGEGHVDGDDPDPASERERRVVFMTDAMPNLGTTGENDLVDLVEGAAADGVHTTFVGMGLDANSDLIDALSGVRGANHYFVNSTEEFRRRLGEEFAYMVTPLVHDLSVDVVADGYEIDAVYGSPDADAATGEVMHVTTLFPSSSEDGANRGGVILLRLRRTGSDPDLDLRASWTRPDGTTESDRLSVTFPEGDDDVHETGGVRKAVLLARYADLLRSWVRDVRSDAAPEEDGDDREVDDWQMDTDGEWEQESVSLRVPEHYRDQFRQFREHLLAEMAAVDDDDLQQEADLLESLVAHEPS